MVLGALAFGDRHVAHSGEGTIAHGRGDIEDHVLGRWVFRGFLLMLDGGKGAEKNLSEIGQNGGAACGDAVLDEEDGDLGDEAVNAGGRLESGEQTEEGRGKVFVLGGQELARDVAETEAGGGIKDGQAAAASGGGEVATTILRGYFGEGLGPALPCFGERLGQSGLRKSAHLRGGSDKRGRFAGGGQIVDGACVSGWLIHVVPRFLGGQKGYPSVGMKRVRNC